MSLLSMLTEPVTIRSRSAGATDAEGNPVATVTDVETRGRLEQSQTDDASDSSRTSSRFVLTLPPDEVIDANAEVLARGQVLRIEGEPFMAMTARGPHHWVVKLAGSAP